MYSSIKSLGVLSSLVIRVLVIFDVDVDGCVEVVEVVEATEVIDAVEVAEVAEVVVVDIDVDKGVDILDIPDVSEVLGTLYVVVVPDELSKEIFEVFEVFEAFEVDISVDIVDPVVDPVVDACFNFLECFTFLLERYIIDDIEVLFEKRNIIIKSGFLKKMI